MKVAENRSSAPDGVVDKTQAKLCKKILLLITEDWFALSHFRPLIHALQQIARSVVVVTRSSGRFAEIEALGAHAIHFNYRRDANTPVAIMQQAWALRNLLRREVPDVVHMVALKPIVVGTLALTGMRPMGIVFHVTGQGLVAVSKRWQHRGYRWLALRAIGRLLRRPNTHLLVENPDDLGALRTEATDPGERCSILGGAGINPNEFPAQPATDNAVPVAAYVGRMIHSKGVDVLMRAYEDLRERGAELHLDLYGMSDPGNPEAMSADTIEAWCERSGARWHGHSSDISGVWRYSDICVVPSRGGEGLPRALLEAAASARPLVVTDVPGNRHFVRNGVEGLIVPACDAASLSSALEVLAGDAAERERMGQAARVRLFAGFTEEHVSATIIASYRMLLSGAESSKVAG